MRNLGGLASGAVAGFVAGKNMQLQQQEVNDLKEYRGRKLQMEETDSNIRKQEADQKKATYDRGEAFRLKRIDIAKKHGFDPDAPIPEPGMAPAATPVAAAPTVGNLGAGLQPQPQQQNAAGERARANAKWLAYQKDLMGAAMAHGSDPEALKQMHDYVMKLDGNQEAMSLMGALEGDADSLDAYARMRGTTADKIKVYTDKKTGRPMVDMGKGAQDVTAHLQVVAGAEAWKAMTDQATRQQGDETHGSKLEVDKAHINQMNAAAEYSREGKKTAIADRQAKVANDIQVALDHRLKSSLPAKPDYSADDNGKTPWVAHQTWVQTRVARSLAGDDKVTQKRANQVFDETVSAYRKKEAQANQDWQQLDAATKKQLVKRAGGRPEAAQQAYLSFVLSKEE